MSGPPLSTYRLQLTPEFGFERAAEIARYLARLGVTHLYTSPYLQAAPGSSHGYDVVDHARVNEELGGEAGHSRLLAGLAEAGLGHILDIVPNHMAIAGRRNRWWWDVLENGASSRYASYFDVSWDPPEPRLRNLILVPVLADHYGRVLSRGELRLEWQAEAGEFVVRYLSHEFPVAPRSLDSLLEIAAERAGSLELERLSEECRELPELAAGQGKGQLGPIDERHDKKESIKRRLAQVARDRPEVAEALEGVAGWVNALPDRLDGLLDRQNYRLARWQTAGQDLDYRRFFDINELVALRVEDPAVFEATHERVLEWLRQGVLDGLRVDHPDGLRDPEEYFSRIQDRAPGAWVVAEKILEPGERLPETWRVAGTTGYDFMNRLLRLFVAPEGLAPLTRIYDGFAGLSAGWPEVVHSSKLRVMDDLLAADLRRLAAAFVRVCEKNRAYRDFTRSEVHAAIRELVACLPVYRTYVRPEPERVTEADREQLAVVAAAAKQRRPDLDPELFDFIVAVMRLDYTGAEESEFVARFQQTSSPVMAKGVEDTAFYIFNRLVCLNEVGGDPDLFAAGLDDFHAACHEASIRWPSGMISTSTHDTKRSEDVRARLAVLSEVSADWAAAVDRWSALNARQRTGDWPDRNSEYLLYQVLVGAYPLPPERALAYMEKATKEAKVHTSWIAPNPDYDAALKRFVEGILSDPAFTADLAAFVRPLLMPGWMTSLSMKLVALTAPGVPDVYQGTELWDLSLVDPDNRRPVDFDKRAALLDEVIGGMSAEEAWRRLDEGLPKLMVVQRALALRRRLLDVFAAGSYQPLAVRGARSEHLIAFAREGRVVTLAPRLLVGLAGGWGSTYVELPEGLWRDEFTGREFGGGQVMVDVILEEFPVGLLVR